MYMNGNKKMKDEEKIQRKEFKRERGMLKEDLGHAKKMNHMDRSMSGAYNYKGKEEKERLWT